MTIERKSKGLAWLIVVLIAAVAGGILLATQASASTSALANTSASSDLTQLAVLTTQLSDPTGDNSKGLVTGDAFGMFGPGFGGGPMGFGRHGGFGRHRMGGFGPIEVSDEYKAAVTTIAKNDPDVQQLLADGYNVTRVMPIIKTTIDAEGNVVTKATNATVVLEKDTSGIAFVSVDLTQSKVTQIATYTRTVIEK